MTEQKVKIFLNLRKNRTQSVFSPDIVFPQSKQDQYAQKSCRQQSEDEDKQIRIRKSQSSLNNREQKSYENFNTSSQTDRPIQDSNDVRLHKTKDLVEKTLKVEQINNLLNNMNKQIIINVGGQNSRKEVQIQQKLKYSNHLKREIQEKDDNVEINTDNIVQNKKNIQIQKLLHNKSDVNQSQENGLISPTQLNFNPFQNSENFFQEIQKTRLKSYSLFQKSSLKTQRDNSNKQSKRLNIQKAKENEETMELTQRNSKRSLSNHFNDLKPKPLPAHTQLKINLIKQFTIKTINQRNQHLLIEASPVINNKIKKQSQQLTPLNQNIPSPKATFFQSESLTFQAKVNQYIQHLKLLQSKPFQQYCNINYVNYKPKLLLEPSDQNSKIVQKVTKQEKFLKKEEQLKGNQNQNIGDYNKIQNYNQNYLNIQQPGQLNTSSHLLKIQKQMVNKSHQIDSIPLCPFNQQQQEVQTFQELAYLDDLDLCQYVQNNTKQSS